MSLNIKQRIGRWLGLPVLEARLDEQQKNLDSLHNEKVAALEVRLNQLQADITILTEDFVLHATAVSEAVKIRFQNRVRVSAKLDAAIAKIKHDPRTNERNELIR